MCSYNSYYYIQLYTGGSSDGGSTNGGGNGEERGSEEENGEEGEGHDANGSSGSDGPTQGIIVFVLLMMCL